MLCKSILKSAWQVYVMPNVSKVNLAFNVTLLWQFIGVLFTPAGSSMRKALRK